MLSWSSNLSVFVFLFTAKIDHHVREFVNPLEEIRYVYIIIIGVEAARLRARFLH